MNLRQQFAADLDAILTTNEMAVEITYTPTGAAAKTIIAHWMKDANGVELNIGSGISHSHGIARVLIKKFDIDLPTIGDTITYLGADYQVKTFEQTLEHAHVINIQHTAKRAKLPGRRTT